MPMSWLLVATGFTGALTLVFLLRLTWFFFVPPASVAARFLAPGEAVANIVTQIKRARREVLVLAPGCNAPAVAEALVEVKLRGVPVEVVLTADDEKDPDSDLHFLLEQGLAPAVQAEWPAGASPMIVLDRRTVLSGSYDLAAPEEGATPDASAPPENLVCIKGYPEVARACRDHVLSRKAAARPAESRVKPKPRVTAPPPPTEPPAPRQAA